MAKIYVPVISNNSDLFEVRVTEHDNEGISLNGMLKGSPSYKEIEPLIEKFRNVFSTGISCLVKIRSKKSDTKLKSFDSSTASVNIGILTSLYAFQNSRKFSKKYESITITGNFHSNESVIILDSVNQILEKYRLAKVNAESNPDTNHLFIYVCDEDEKTVKEGWTDNLFVIAVSPKEKIECVFAEVFELSDEQKKQLSSELEYSYKNDYIETPSFINWKKEIIKNSSGGFIIQGISNSGKSIAAANLYKYLFITNSIDQLVWITLKDNKQFWDEITELYGNELFQDKTDIIKNHFQENFNKLDDLLKFGKKVCLVVDNIEGEFVDEFLAFFNSNYQSYVAAGILKLIITSWKKANDEKLIQLLKLEEVCSEKLEINRNEFNRIFYSVLNSMRDKNVFYDNSVYLKEKFMNLLYIQCFDENIICPGFINLALAPLHEVELSELLAKYEQKKIKFLSPKKRFVKIDFEFLDSITQLVLFAYIGMNNYWHEIDYSNICRILNEKIFNTAITGINLVSEMNIEKSVQNLLRNKLLESSNRKSYYIKTDVIEYCVFSDAASEELAKGLEKVRDYLIPMEIKIEYAIQTGHHEEFTKFLQEYDDMDGINHLFIHCIQYDKGLDYLKPLVEKGINPDYKDEDQESAIDVIWCQQPDMEVLDFLLEKGFKPRNKIPCHDRKGNKFVYSPLLIAVNKCYIPLIKRIIENHLYDDINEYEFQEKWTALQLYAALGTSVEAIELLIKAGSDSTLKTKDSWNLLMCAAANKETPEIFEYLIQNKVCVDFEYKDKEGNTALDYAKRYGNDKAVELFKSVKRF